MEKRIFRFGIMGAGIIAHKFCDAVRLIEDCEVVAVASKSMERAKNFAKEESIKKAYDNYEQMLKEEELDGVYIAVTADSHYDLSMLCLDYNVPVLCEKAMYPTSREAKEVFSKAKDKKLFIMEAMWSRFLPAIQKAKKWIEDGAIGEILYGDVAIGFKAPYDENNRYWNPKLGGGAALDLTVYSYELITYLIDQPIKDMKVSAIWSDTGVDATDHITLQYEKAIASVMATLSVSVDQKIVVYGSKGSVIVPNPIFASQAILYNSDHEIVESFEDTITKNGFIYEIKEMIHCIEHGKLESEITPHSMTIACCEMYDQIWLTKK